MFLQTTLRPLRLVRWLIYILTLIQLVNSFLRWLVQMSKHASAFACLSKHLVAETKAFNVVYLFGCSSDFGCSLSLKPVSTHLSVSPLVCFHFLLFLRAAPWVTVILGKPRRYWIGLQGEVLGNVSALIRGAKGNKYWHVILFFTPPVSISPLLFLCLFSFIVARGRGSVSLGMKMDLNEIFFCFFYPPSPSTPSFSLSFFLSHGEFLFSSLRTLYPFHQGK